MLKEYLTQIANRLRTALETSEKINAQDFPEKISEAASYAYTMGYENGEMDGWSDGMSEGYEEGKKAQYDEYWDAIQDNGNRTYYDYRFYGYTNDIYKPKYPINAVSADMMYYSSKITDLSDINWNSGKLRRLYYTFTNCYKLEKIGVIDMSYTGAYKSNALYSTFASCFVLTTIEKLKLSEKGDQTFYQPFGACNKLANIVIEGKIGSTLSFYDSPLTNDSAKSVINALVDYAGTSSEGKYKVTFKSTVKDALIAEGATAPDGKTWEEYVTAKGWTW